MNTRQTVIEPLPASDLFGPFRWVVGTLQLFIVGDGLFVPTTIGEYDRNKPIGTEWERAYTQAAVDALNAAWVGGDVRHDETRIKQTIRDAEKATPWPNIPALPEAGRNPTPTP